MPMLKDEDDGGVEGERGSKTVEKKKLVLRVGGD